jgi:hypothetical protein
VAEFVTQHLYSDTKNPDTPFVIGVEMWLGELQGFGEYFEKQWLNGRYN